MDQVGPPALEVGDHCCDTDAFPGGLSQCRRFRASLREVFPVAEVRTRDRVDTSARRPPWLPVDLCSCKQRPVPLLQPPRDPEQLVLIALRAVVLRRMLRHLAVVVP
jgi:hypothetical protein